MAEAAAGRVAAGFDPGLEAVERPRFSARLAEAVEGERAQWFNWVPVLFGLGIGLYFHLGFEPALAWALAPLGVALALMAARPLRDAGCNLCDAGGGVRRGSRWPRSARS